MQGLRFSHFSLACLNSWLNGSKLKSKRILVQFYRSLCIFTLAFPSKTRFFIEPINTGCYVWTLKLSRELESEEYLLDSTPPLQLIYLSLGNWCVVVGIKKSASLSCQVRQTALRLIGAHVRKRWLTHEKQHFGAWHPRGNRYADLGAPAWASWIQGLLGGLSEMDCGVEQFL